MQMHRSRWDENEMMSIYPGVSPICTPRCSVHCRYLCLSVHLLSLIHDVLGGRDRASSVMHLEAEIEWTQRCTWRARLSTLRDALGGHDRASLEMRWEAMIQRVRRCTLTPWSSEVGDAIGDRDWVNSAIGNWLGAGGCRSWDDVELNVCCTRC